MCGWVCVCVEITILNTWPQEEIVVIFNLLESELVGERVEMQVVVYLNLGLLSGIC